MNALPDKAFDYGTTNHFCTFPATADVKSQNFAEIFRLIDADSANDILCETQFKICNATRSYSESNYNFRVMFGERIS